MFAEETYAKYQLCISYASFVALFGMMGLNQVCIQSAANREDGNFLIIMKIRFLLSLAGSVVWFLILYYTKIWAGYSLLVIPAILALSFRHAGDIITNFLVGKNKIQITAIYRVGFFLIGLGVLYYLGLKKFDNISIVVLSLFSLPLSLTAVLFFYALRLRENRQVEKSRIKLGMHYSIAGILATGVFALQKPIISKSLSLYDVAIFSMAFNFVEQLKILVKSINTSVYPDFSKQKTLQKVWGASCKYVILLFVLFIIIGFCLAAVIPYVFNFLLSEKYAAAVPYAQWLSVFIGWGAISGVIRSMLSAQKKFRSIYIYDVGLPIIVLLLWLMLLPKFGLWGMVYARGISLTIANIAIFVLLFYEIYKEKKEMYADTIHNG